MLTYQETTFILNKNKNIFCKLVAYMQAFGKDVFLTYFKHENGQKSYAL